MRVLQKKLRPTLEFENAAYSRGFSKIAGIDEAGRGPLAGPVVVAAVILGNIQNNLYFSAGYRPIKYSAGHFARDEALLCFNMSRTRLSAC